MKAFVKTSLLFLIMCGALQLTSADTLSSDMATSTCCFNDTSKIPLKRITSYFWTSTICPLKFVVFVTIKKKQFCAKPENAWVKRAIKYIDKNSAN
ncbi:monocyte chemotactic protein 1B-like [Puntigrus tetrazona]|uniref:monocyte chemotactic protein 1B-like n=1 Tax=Puntigrus tetrazona TaxID=1606681 RepID=UPI001C89A2F1|nr:monocyte chemotactic protein 1B-like [Puntigrus tetrazona]